MDQKLQSLNVPQLKFIARELKIKGRHKMSKADLINELGKFSDEDIDKLFFKAILMYNYYYYCEHGIKKYSCKECGGSQICVHRKRKSYCVLCDGSEICVHNKQKSFCKECGGSQICEHNKQKYHCKEC